MSTFNIYQKLEYTVMLSDSLGTRKAPTGDIIPMLAPKLVHVAPCIYASHAGKWQPALDVLHQVREYAMTEKDILHDDFVQSLASLGQKKFFKYENKYNEKGFDLRIPLVVTGRYRSPIDVQLNSATSILTWETANNFVPTRTHTYISWGGSAQVSNLMTAIMKLPQMNFWLNSGPLAVAQGLEAVHALVARVTHFVSQECNIAIIGENEEHTVLKGTLVKLSNKSLLWG